MTRLSNSDYLALLRSSELESVLSILAKQKRKTCQLNILEIGAGTGWQARRLSEAGYDVQAIDLEQGNKPETRVWPVIEYDGRHLPFVDNYFDVVFSSNVLEHIPHLVEFQSEIHRVLKPDCLVMHVLPSCSWRLWTSVSHYPYLIKMLMRIFVGRKGGTLDPGDAQASARIQGRSKAELIKKALIPARHGETGSSLTELYTFSRPRWRTVFRKSGWKIEKTIPNRLFYTGNLILGSAISLTSRKYLSYVLGSSCHVFVLTREAKKT